MGRIKQLGGAARKVSLSDSTDSKTLTIYARKNNFLQVFVFLGTTSSLIPHIYPNLALQILLAALIMQSQTDLFSSATSGFH